MLRAIQYLGPMLTLELINKDSETGAVNVFKQIKTSKLKNKKLRLKTSEGIVEIEIDKTKSLEIITPISKSEIDDICAGRL